MNARAITRKVAVWYIGDDGPDWWAIQDLVDVLRAESRRHDSGAGFLRDSDRFRPGCLLVGLHAGDRVALDLLVQIRVRQLPAAAVLLARDPDVATVVQAMRLGAVDAVLDIRKRSKVSEVVERAILISLESEERVRTGREIASRFGSLSPRERAVMQLVVAGLTNRQIAQELGISARTVEVHRGRVMKKTRTASVPELVRIAFQAERFHPPLPESAPVLQAV